MEGTNMNPQRPPLAGKSAIDCARRIIRREPEPAPKPLLKWAPGKSPFDQVYSLLRRARRSRERWERQQATAGRGRTPIGDRSSGHQRSGRGRRRRSERGDGFWHFGKCDQPIPQILLERAAWLRRQAAKQTRDAGTAIALRGAAPIMKAEPAPVRGRDRLLTTMQTC